MSDDDEVNLDLVMPFVTVVSKGGPHDDDSYVAGYAMGLLDAKLSDGGHQEPLAVRDDCLPQVDLLAMRYGYTVAIWDGEDLQPQPGAR